MNGENLGSGDIGRLNAFSDGVMVVSMTLLVLDVRLPDSLTNLDGSQLFHALAALWPKYFGYVLSFLVIAQYWLGYTEKFGRMRTANGGFARLNVFFLLTIGFIPFATAVLSQNQGWVATSLYAATMVVVSSFLIVMWFYALRKGLIEARLPPGQRWQEISGWIQIAAVFASSIIVAQYDPRVARVVWLLLAVPNPSSPKQSP